MIFDALQKPLHRNRGRRDTAAKIGDWLSARVINWLAPGLCGKRTFVPAAPSVGSAPNADVPGSSAHARERTIVQELRNARLPPRPQALIAIPECVAGRT